MLENRETGGWTCPDIEAEWSKKHGQEEENMGPCGLLLTWKLCAI